MIATTHGRQTIDSVLFDPRTLVPYWERANGSETTAVSFSARGVTGQITADVAGGRDVHASAHATVYSSTMDDFVIRSLPLSAGYRSVLSFWSGDHIEVDSVSVQVSGVDASKSGARPTWTVDFVEPAATETLWVDDDSREIVKHTYLWKRDGSLSEVSKTC